MANPRNGTSQLFKSSPAKRFNELISQKQREELLRQIVSGVYDPSNVVDDAIKDENRNPYVRSSMGRAIHNSYIIRFIMNST